MIDDGASSAVRAHLPPTVRSQLSPLIDKLEQDADVHAALLVGSSTRGYRDALSDLDVEVIVRDPTYDALARSARFTASESEARVEILVLPERDFRAKKDSSADTDHWRYEDCVVIYDPRGVARDELPEIVAMPDDLRRARTHLHYFEFLFFAQRLRTRARFDDLNWRLVAGQAAFSAVRLLFVAAGRWPPVAHWAAQNLACLPSPMQAEAGAVLLELMRDPGPQTARASIQLVDRVMYDVVPEYVDDKTELTRTVVSNEYRQVRERFGIL